MNNEKPELSERACINAVAILAVFDSISRRSQESWFTTAEISAESLFTCKNGDVSIKITYQDTLVVGRYALNHGFR